MQNPILTTSAAGLALALLAGGAAAAPDWSKVPARTITVLYPGVSPIEWVMTGTEHGGARGVKKGEACSGCHDEEAADMGQKMASGEKIEPAPIKGKAGSIPVKVQAAHDAANLYLRFSWKQPPGGGPKMDAENQVKLAVMLEGNTIERADLSGCWETCHQDARTMPGAKDEKKTKYVTGGDVKTGKFYDLIQWTSKGAKHDGYVADRRVMDGGKALVDAKGEKKGDEWTVTFTRKLTGGEGDIALAPGKVYNLGFAIHDDYTHGRFHQVSLGYTLGIGAQADITAVK
ncbi:MAG: hypothetical protein IT486_05185 [Gammaproteobacteria bacterium]|nr:hypothetical protein [Gammaproteobacteria bacterium]